MPLALSSICLAVILDYSLFKRLNWSAHLGAGETDVAVDLEPSPRPLAHETSAGR